MSGFGFGNGGIRDLMIRDSKIVLEVGDDGYQVFLFDFGRYLINPAPNPRALKLVINDMTEMIVVANPTCSVVNNLAFIIQNTKPKTDMTKVDIIKYNEFL